MTRESGAQGIVAVAPIGKSMYDHHGLVDTVVQRLMRRGATVLLDFQDTHGPGCETISVGDVLNGVPVPSGTRISRWPGRSGRPSPHDDLHVAAEAVLVAHSLVDRGISVVVNAPWLLPGQEWLHTGFVLPAADHMLYACTPDQLAQWAELAAPVLEGAKNLYGRTTINLLILGKPAQETGGRAFAIGRLKTAADTVMDLSDMHRRSQGLFPGLSHLLGLAEDEIDIEEALEARAVRAAIAYEPLVERVRALIERLLVDTEGGWEFGRLGEVDVASLVELVDVISEGVDVLSDHSEVFRRTDLYHGDFWYEAFSLSSKAAPAIVRLLPAARVRTLVLSLTEAYSHTFDRALDVTKRGEMALVSALSTADNAQLNELVSTYAATVSADFSEKIQMLLK